MCCPKSIPQKLMSLVPPVFGDHHHAPWVLAVAMVETMYLEGHRVIGC